MKKIPALLFVLFVSLHSMGQIIGKVDRKSKEFLVAPDQKIAYRVYGYQFANINMKKMICFSSSVNDVGSNYANCPLGSYYNTNQLKEGDRIFYLGNVGTFGKMNYVTGAGKKILFYLPRKNFVMK
jgi:hypothetical protein